MPHLLTTDDADIVNVTVRCAECHRTFKHYPLTAMDNAPTKCLDCRGGFLL